MKSNIFKLGFISYLSIFILVGFYFTVMGCLPIEVKISNIDNVATAQIHKKSIIPPFKDVIIKTIAECIAR